MKKKIIGVDIDDVLAISAEKFVEFSNITWGTNFTVEDYDEDWTTMWNIEHAESRNRSDIWHASGEIAKKKPRENGYEALLELARNYELVVVTSRRKVLEKDTLVWIDEHFKNIFSAIHFSGIWDTNAKKSTLQTKAELSKSLGIDYLIDDQVKHCIGVANEGIQALLFGDYSWNRNDAIPEGVTRVKDWPAVLEYFNDRN